MSGIKSVKPIRRFITRVLATALLLAVYSVGALAVSGIASIAGASTAFAQRDDRGRGRSSRSSRSRSVGRSTSRGSTGRRGAGRGFNKGTSMGVGDSASSGNVRGVGSSEFRRPGFNKGSSIGVGDSASSGDVRGVGSSFGGGRGPESRGGGTSGRENVETARGGNLDTRRGGSASKTSDETKREIEYCAQQFRSYDRETMTYTDYDGRRRSCP